MVERMYRGFVYYSSGYDACINYLYWAGSKRYFDSVEELKEFVDSNIQQHTEYMES